MTPKSDAKFVSGFKNDMRYLVNFNESCKKSQNVHFMCYFLNNI